MVTESDVGHKTVLSMYMWPDHPLDTLGQTSVLLFGSEDRNSEDNVTVHQVHGLQVVTALGSG